MGEIRGERRLGMARAGSRAHGSGHVLKDSRGSNRSQMSSRPTRIPSDRVFRDACAAADFRSQQQNTAVISNLAR